MPNRDKNIAEIQERLEQMYKDRIDAAGGGLIVGGASGGESKENQFSKTGDLTVHDKGVNDVPIHELSDDTVKSFIQSMIPVPKDRMYKPVKYNERNDNFTHRISNDEYNLRLGDCVFRIPPEFINVSETSRTVKEPSIRANSTIKKKYGYSHTDITIRFMVCGKEQINGFEVDSPFEEDKKDPFGVSYKENLNYYVDGIRPFIAQCKVSPIMPVENKFLNMQCGVYSLSIQNVQIKTVEGFPLLLECTIMASEFDSSVYTMCPAWEISNLIDWDLYRYNYQRMMQRLIPAGVGSYIDNSYLIKPMYNYSVIRELDILMPDLSFMVDDTFEGDIENKIFDVRKIPYKNILNSFTDEFTVAGIQFGFENIVVSPKLSGFSKPTAQYLGGGDNVISMQIFTRSEETVGKFKSLIGKTQNYIKQYPEVSGLGFVKIDNEFLKLVGIKNMMLDVVTVETLPNFPGTYSINIQASGHDVHTSSAEEIKGQRPFINNRKGTKEDCISQDLRGVSNKVMQDLYKEYKLNESDLYPDLFLPTYDELDYIIPKINEFNSSRDIKPIPFNRYPRRISSNSIFCIPYAMTLRVDPDFYYMYPYVDMSKMKVKIEDLVENINNIEGSNVDHIYKNNFEVPSSDGNYSGDGSLNLDSLGAEATSVKDLGINCQRGVDAAFLDSILAKNGCGYVMGANGQIMYAKNDPSWTKANEDRLHQYGGPVKDKWRGKQVFDCSGLVGYGMYKLGYFKEVPRFHHTVFQSYCVKVSLSDIRPGDFLIGPNHIAVAIGGGKTIEAMNSDKGVLIGNVGNRFNWAGRPSWKNSNEDIAEKYKNYKSRGINDNPRPDNYTGGTTGGGAGSSNQEIGFKSIGPRIQMSRMPQMERPADGSAEIMKIGKYGGASDRFDSIIMDKSKKYGVNPNWVKALIKTESGFNPTAVSSADTPAMGLMQLIKGTAQGLGVPGTKAYLFVPENNIDVGTKYYAQLHSKYNDYIKAAGAYNVGPGAFDRYLAGKRTLPTETINHMQRVQANYDELIEGGGTDSGWSSGGTTSDNYPDNVFQTQFIHKKHGDKKMAFKGRFGIPMFFRSPLNYLLKLDPKTDAISTDIAIIRRQMEKLLTPKKEDPHFKEIADMMKQQEMNIKEELGIEYTDNAGSVSDEIAKKELYTKLAEWSSDRENKYSLLASTIDSSIYGSRGSMIKAFPTFVFMISTDMYQWLDGRKLWDNFYPYKAIMAMSIAHDHEQPVGTAVIRASNISQNLTRRPKIAFKDIHDDKEYGGPNRYLYENFGFIMGTPKVTDLLMDSHNRLLKEMKLSSGARIHIRMGYGSCVQSLPVVFNGTVVEVGGDEYLEIIAQSDGAELINTVVSTDEDKSNSLGKLQKEASNIVTSLLIDRASWLNVINKKWGESNEYGIEHFGLFTGKNWTGLFNNREFEWDLCKNIYVGEYNQKLFCAMNTADVFDGEETIEFFLYNRTPWDCANITAQTLPEFVSYPKYHGFESRMFFGVPYWLFRYRYDVNADGSIMEHAKSFSQLHLINSNDILDNRIKASSKFMHTNAICTYVLGNNAQKDIKCTTTIFSDASIDWSKQKTKVIDTALQQNYIGPDGLYEFFGFAPGVTNAESVAITSLLESFSKSYYDEIICLGQASITPYDEIFIDDHYAQMYGLARVNKVVHSIGPDTGFTTSITPGMLSYSKTEDSGSTNTHRNRMNIMDTASAILGGRYSSVALIDELRYLNEKFSHKDEEEFSDFIMDSIVNIKPIHMPEHFCDEVITKSQKVHLESRAEHIKNLVGTEYRSVLSNDSYINYMQRSLTRIPFLRSVSGFFVYYNTVGIRPLLHKSKPFCVGVKGSKNLIEGYGQLDDSMRGD